MFTRLQRHAVALTGAVALVALGRATALRAQEPPTLEYGSVARLHSQVLGEERRLNVHLPAGYAESSARYPVLYVLDGSAHEDYFHVASLIDFLATYEVVPETIVVGISNVDRKRDFTPPSTDPLDQKAAPTSGGADRFVRFLETELLPYVDSHYRTAGPRTLVGQSLGGLLATQVLLQKPSLFDDYVIVSPSLWWNHQALLKGAAAALQKSATPKRRVYLSIAAEHPEMREVGQGLAAALRASGWDELHLRFDDLADETHATSLHISVYKAMKFFHPPPAEPAAATKK